jgi:hypothetical protein
MWLHFNIIFMLYHITLLLFLITCCFLSSLTNILHLFVGMAASQPNKATTKWGEEKDGEGEMPGWWEEAARKVREEDADVLERKK